MRHREAKKERIRLRSEIQRVIDRLAAAKGDRARALLNERLAALRQQLVELN